MEKIIKEYNEKLYEDGYNKNMITTREAFIKFYQDFLDENEELESFGLWIKSKIKEVKESKELYVMDCLILDESISLFSTMEELNKLMEDLK